MKAFVQNITLPKITHKNIQQLIYLNRKAPLVSQNLLRHTHNKNKEIHYERNNRHSDFSLILDKKQFGDCTSEHLKIKSPFYKKIHLQNSNKCPCQFHKLKRQQFQLSNKERAESNDFDKLILNKINEMKRYQESASNHIKKQHLKNHEKMNANQLNYLENSIEKLNKRKQQKLRSTIKNQQNLERSLEKTKTEHYANKEFKKIFFKQKLQQIYQLDNLNEPFQKILQKRNGWEKDKKMWGYKILKIIHKKLRKGRYHDIKLKEQKQENQVQNQQDLLSIQKCLPLILNNISSIDEIVNQNSTVESRQKIEGIFIKNLKLDEKKKSKCLFKYLKQIVQEIANKNSITFKQIENQKQPQDANSDLATKQQQIQPLSQQKQKYCQNSVQFSSNDKQNQRINECTSIKNNNSLIFSLNTQQTESEDQQKKRSQKLSQMSSKSNLSKKLSKVSKISFTSSSILNNSLLSKRNNDENQKPKDAQNSLTVQNLAVSKKLVENDIFENQINKKSINCSLNITPSLSKHLIICEKQEQQQDENNEAIDAQQQEERMKAMKYKKSAKQIEDQLEQQQIERVFHIIEFIKKRIMLRKAVISVPEKYLHIKYQHYCSNIAFRFITSQIDNLQGSAKYKLLYSQLQLKNRILEDDYVKNVIKQFSTMFKDQQELNEWKKYLFEKRSKLMFQKLNRMIDLGIKQADSSKVGPTFQIKEQKSDSIRNQQSPIFSRFDESQVAYERYLQKLEIKHRYQKHSIILTEKNSNLLESQTQNKAQSQLTQKTINQNIETNSNKTILYSYIEHDRLDDQSCTVLQSSIENGKQQFKKISKKKILKYMLKKKPKQFQLLNKDINEFSQLINKNFR